MEQWWPCLNLLLYYLDRMVGPVLICGPMYLTRILRLHCLFLIDAYIYSLKMLTSKHNHGVLDQRQRGGLRGGIQVGGEGGGDDAAQFPLSSGT